LGQRGIPACQKGRKLYSLIKEKLKIKEGDVGIYQNEGMTAAAMLVLVEAGPVLLLRDQCE